MASLAASYRSTTIPLTMSYIIYCIGKLLTVNYTLHESITLNLHVHAIHLKIYIKYKIRQSIHFGCSPWDAHYAMYRIVWCIHCVHSNSTCWSPLFFRFGNFSNYRSAALISLIDVNTSPESHESHDLYTMLPNHNATCKSVALHEAIIVTTQDDCIVSLTTLPFCLTKRKPRKSWTIPRSGAYPSKW